jgi:hypothetical protein
MRNFFFSLFAIGVAAVAAMTATTALLNTPVRQHATPAVNTLTQADPAPPTQAGSTPAAPAGEGAATPPAEGAKPAEGAADGKPAAAEEEGDKDPYEGIAPEELPPDLQYSADSSVSFPTNI